MHNRFLHVLPVVVIAGLVGCSSSDKKDSSGDGVKDGAGGTAGSKGSGGESESGDAAAGGAKSTGGTKGSTDVDGSTGSPDAGQSDSGGGGTGAVGPGAPGWTVMPLLDDDTKPDNTVFRAGNDLVTGIYFASPEDGWVTTRHSNQTFGSGGAIYKAKSKSVTSLLFSGNRDGLCLGGSISFNGLDPSPDGLVALAYACDVIQSHDHGKTFELTRNEAGSAHGIERTLAMHPLPSGGTLMFADSGYIDTAPTAPGPSADWTTVWAPEANPPTPNPVPEGDCQVIQKNVQPPVRTNVYVSPRADLIAYVAVTEAQEPVICMYNQSQTDAGELDSVRHFVPRSLPNLPANATDFAPSGVLFSSDAKVGITFWANNLYPGAGYIYRTEDAGNTWKSVPIPSAMKKEIDLYSAFMAPDGTHVWIVGYNYDSNTSLLLRSSDAGKTWNSASGDLAAKTASMGIPRLFSGFALDAYHIWVGGDFGILAANEAGGD